jgi:hypothetical protein
MKIKAVFKIREVAIPDGYRKLVNGETVKAGDFAFFKLGTPSFDYPVWHQLTNQAIIGTKLTRSQSKTNQSDWVIRKIV